MNGKEISVATLSEDSVSKVKNMESELREQTNEDIILIAYQNGGDSIEGRE
ncbi:hypothetical protein [Bacillus sp. BHET2]|uniref:hypothetical protein n=1 Tax=Bacillus sp. BHET2 TaxID=2583818 RepID=UPI001486922A|nr:hypothetical protein [Bacillus sp. BHET2]